MKTLLLDRTAWDLVLDASGNIALASEPYAIAQDVASAVRTFLGECWYDTAIGIPYFAQVLGLTPPLALVQSLISGAAMAVPEVSEVQVVFASLTGLTLTGEIQIIDTTGVANNVSF